MTENKMRQDHIDRMNENFWNELCGSILATSHGIVNKDRESIRRFDDLYFDMYPYLSDYIPFESVAGKEVLEIGLGYGSVSQKLFEAGARYTGLDIAPGPVDMVQTRLSIAGTAGVAVQGNALSMQFPDNSFDYVVAIGCLHHTGDLAQAIDECSRVLRPNGTLIFMVYNAYSYRRWYRARVSTLIYFAREILGYRGSVGAVRARDRAAYDLNAAGAAAPHTEWISVKSLSSLCKNFSSFNAERNNIDAERPYKKYDRDFLLSTWRPRFWGLDIYVTARK